MLRKVLFCMFFVVLATGYSQVGRVLFSEARSVPKMLNYQGYLTDTLGSPINGSLDMTFRIFDAATVGNELWNETQADVPIERGVFSVVLGSDTPIPDTVFTHGFDRWLELTLEGPQTLSPRTRITAMGYAYTATYADTAQYAATDNDWVRQVDGDSVLFTANYLGLARGNAGNVMYGESLHTYINLGVACTTGALTDDDLYCTIGGGYGNSATNHSTVCGGVSNSALGGWTFIGGGEANETNWGFSVVSGGYYNSAKASQAVVCGGFMNTAKRSNDFVGGGSHNTAGGAYSVVCGGYNNTTGFGDDFIGGGYMNTTDSTGGSSVICGGSYNMTSGQESSIGGGLENNITGDHNTIGGGSRNQVTGYMATIGGGDTNTVTANLGTIAGGASNTVNGIYGTISGGLSNYANEWSAIGGGQNNRDSCTYGTIGGGGANMTRGDYSTVGGGKCNRALAKLATIGGGGGTGPVVANLVTDSCGTIGGGGNNQAGDNAGTTVDAIYATVSGGYDNQASGNYASIPGGRQNIADGNYSFAAGWQAEANHAGTFVWADSTNASFTSSGTNQFLIRASGGVGIGTTSPSEKLQIDNGHIKIGTADYGLMFYGGGERIIGTTGWGIDFQTDNGTSRMSILNNGNVGIGTVNPIRKLHVSDVLRLEPRSTAPPDPSEGDMYMDNTNHKLMVYDGSTWQACW